MLNLGFFLRFYENRAPGFQPSSHVGYSDSNYEVSTCKWHYAYK